MYLYVYIYIHYIYYTEHRRRDLIFISLRPLLTLVVCTCCLLLLSGLAVCTCFCLNLKCILPIRTPPRLPWTSKECDHSRRECAPQRQNGAWRSCCDRWRGGTAGTAVPVGGSDTCGLLPRLRLMTYTLNSFHLEGWCKIHLPFAEASKCLQTEADTTCEENCQSCCSRSRHVQNWPAFPQSLNWRSWSNFKSSWPELCRLQIMDRLDTKHFKDRQTTGTSHLELAAFDQVAHGQEIIRA